MSLATTRTRTTRSGVEHTNHEATAPPTVYMAVSCKIKILQVKQLSGAREFDCHYMFHTEQSENTLAIFYIALIFFNLIILYSC